MESYTVHTKPWEEVDGLKGKPDWREGPHFFYELGPAIVPSSLTTSSTGFASVATTLA